MLSRSHDLIAGLWDAGLLDPGRLHALAARPGTSDAAALARRLVADRLLTPYQAALALDGRSRDLLLGPFVLVEPLGEGGMGQVFRAAHRETGAAAAVKVLPPAAGPDAAKRFAREARAAAALAHPNVVAVLDADCEGPRPYLAMELIDGPDLARLVRRDGPLPVAAACDYARQAALGLHHAHEAGLVHRDVKPHNLLLAPGGVVKLLDLGLVRLTDAGPDGALTQDAVVVGSPDYIAPEQARNPRTVDARADLYALGCTLYHLLAGRPPFAGDTAVDKILKHELEEPPPLEELRPGLPRAVAAVARRLMAKRPDGRYPDALAGADALAAATPPASAPARPAVVLNVEAPEPPRPAARPGRAVVLRGHTAAVTALAFSADGTRLATGGVDEQVRVWDVAGPAPAELAARTAGRFAGLCALALRPGRPAVAAGRSAADGAVWLWDWESGASLPLLGEPCGVDALAFAPSGDLLAAAYGKVVRVWSLAGDRARPRATLKGHRGAVKALAFAPDGRLLAAGDEAGVVTLWRPGRLWWARSGELAGPRVPVTSLAYASDGRLLAAAGPDRAVRVWDAAGPEPVAVLGPCEGAVRGLAFADAGRVLAADDRGRATLWDAAAGTPLREWRSEAGLVSQVAASAAGLVAAGASDGTVTLTGVDVTA